MNCLPIKDILRYHNTDSYALHPSTTRKQIFENLCVTRPDPSGVPLIKVKTIISRTYTYFFYPDTRTIYFITDQCLSVLKSTEDQYLYMYAGYRAVLAEITLCPLR